MKALVISNCATAYYVQALQVLCPGWTVKGVQVHLAERWISTDPNAAFIAYVDEVEVYFGLPIEGSLINSRLSKNVAKYYVPAFSFRGLHPDSFHLAEHRSVLEVGNIFSRIVCACYLQGRGVTETVATFREEVFDRLGYFHAFEDEKQNLISRFLACGMDLSESFEHWNSKGKFLYTYNHPKSLVLADIISARGSVICGKRAYAHYDELIAIHDYLGDSIIWPVYPDIAARHGIKDSLVWRKGAQAGYEEIGLIDFVAQSFENLAQERKITANSVSNLEFILDAIG